MKAAARPLAERLNDACHCVRVDQNALAGQLGAAVPTLPESMVSGEVVFVDQAQAAAMDRTLAMITRAIRSPAFGARVESSAPAIAHQRQATTGGMLGFDFHLGRSEPQLIEINTNPGGLLIGLELARAVAAMCDCFAMPVTVMTSACGPIDAVEGRALAYFLREFERARGRRPLRTVAIVDDSPQQQYLLPEFRLFQGLFERAGLRVHVADPGDLVIRGDALMLASDPIDLVYNRCTDFYFAEAAHSALREAYERDLAVITPHPAAHARWADKRILAWLREESLLREAGLDGGEIAHLLETIPVTEIVDATRAGEYWARRKDLFFKPVDGFGGKAAYRGDKLTRKTFDHILSSRYVAQALAPTSSRQVRATAGGPSELRVDVRNFAEDGQTWLRTARLYRGQATNFRTTGGGFAPVLTVPTSFEHG